MNLKATQRLIADLMFALIGVFSLGGCDQPIHETLVVETPTTDVDLEMTRNPTRHNWPIQRNTIVISKPPPLAYLTSYSSRIETPPLTLPDPSTWQSKNLTERAKEYIQDLCAPIPSQIPWAGTISRDNFAGPQAFDISPDGRRLVTVHQNQFSLFNAETGSHIGSRDLPGSWTNSKPTAIRFAPSTKDLLVASADRIARISGKDGSLVHSVKGPGEEIKKWLVADDESYMVMLTQSGKLLAGDATLETLGPLQLTGIKNSDRFEDFGLSLDGVRVLLVANGSPRTYIQENGKIVDYVDHGANRFSGSAAVAAGLRDDVWCQPGYAFYTFAETGPNSRNEFDPDATKAKRVQFAARRNSGGREMFWRTAMLQFVRSPIGEWSIAVSERPKNGKRQWVVHDLNVRSGLNSVPLPLERRPSRFLVNRGGNRLVIADETSIRVAPWVRWRSTPGYIADSSWYEMFDDGDFQSIEQICDYLHEENRWTHNGSSQDRLTRLLERISYRWAILAEKSQTPSYDMSDAESETLKRCNAWYQSGGLWARMAHAKMLGERSWRARYNKDNFGGDTWDRYAKLQTQCLSEWQALLEEQRPPAMAISEYIGCFLESNDGPEKLDSLCRRHIELYPRTKGITVDMGFKLLPQWYGEKGDCMSYLTYHAKLFEAPFSGLLYGRCLGSTGTRMGDSSTEWQGLDRNLLNQGIDYAIENKHQPLDWFYNCLLVYRLLELEPERMDQMRRHILEMTAVMPEDRMTFVGLYLHQEREAWTRLINEVK